jgi:hypothetical protein
MNCHPAGDHPLQGADRHIHQPVAFRGEANNGVPGLVCATCHSDRNFTLSIGEASYQSIPGHPRWALAPLEMAWEGKSVGDICRQIKDPTRNGGRTLALLHEHIAKDDLVAWAWSPGAGRTPAPGTQEQLGILIQAWIETGAECPWGHDFLAAAKWVRVRPSIGLKSSSVRQKMMVVNTASLSANRGSLVLLTGGLGFFARQFFALVIFSM